jgi:protein-S-isoprenylcysteine O-methyltransferase Ste14
VFILTRALVSGTLFVGFLLVFLPARVLTWSGIMAPPLGGLQVGGIVVAIAGGALAVSCVLSFVFIGRGTPAPFDPPRQLVVRGPYRFVRNPMYVGAVVALLGAAIYYESLALAAYAVAFLLVMHAFVVLYEEPVLTRRFGADFEAYRQRVPRWLPVR